MSKINEKAAKVENTRGKAQKMSSSDQQANAEKANGLGFDTTIRGGFEAFKGQTSFLLNSCKKDRLKKVKAEVLAAIEEADTQKAASLLRSCSANDEEEKEITQSALQSACEFSPVFSEFVEKAKEETDGLLLAFVNVEDTTSEGTLQKVSEEKSLFYVDGHAWGKVPTNSTARALGSYLTFTEWQKDLVKAKVAKKRSAVDAAAASIVTACKAAPLEMRDTLLNSLSVVYGESAANVARQRLALSAKVDEARASLLGSASE